MFKLTDSMIADERRQDLLRKLEQQHRRFEVLSVPQDRPRRRLILAKIGNQLVKWGAYLEAHYGEPEPQVKLRV